MIELPLLLYLAYAASPGLTCQTPPCASIFLPFRPGEVVEVFDVFALAAFDAVCTVVALASCVAFLPCCFREFCRRLRATAMSGRGRRCLARMFDRHAGRFCG